MISSDSTEVLDKNVPIESEIESPTKRRNFVNYCCLFIFLAFCIFGFNACAISCGQYVLHRISLDLNFVPPNGTSLCDRNQTSDPKMVDLQNKVNKRVASFNMITSFAHGFPILLVSPLLGAFSDTLGRKILILIPCLGILAFSVCCLLVIWLTAPLWLIIIANLLLGVCGSYQTMMVGVYAFLADTQSGPELTKLMFVTGMLLNVYIMCAQLGIGVWIQHFNFLVPYLCCTLAVFVSLLIGCFLLPETAPNAIFGRQRPRRQQQQKQEQEQHPPSYITSISNELQQEQQQEQQAARINLAHVFRQLLHIFQVERTRSILIATAIFIFFCITLNQLSLSNIVQVYVFSQPFCWDSVTYGVYSALQNAASKLGMLTFIALAHWRVGSDETYLIVSCCSALVSRIVFSLAAQFGRELGVVLIYTSLATSIFMEAGMSALRSSYSKLVGPMEQGSAFSILANFEALSTLIGPLIFWEIYRETADFFPGLVFLIFVPFIGVTIISVVFYKKWRGKIPEYKLI